MSEESHQANGKDISFQDESGWRLMTYYQAENDGYDTLAYKNALKRASSSDRQVMIRSYNKNSLTFWEVWEYW